MQLRKPCSICLFLCLALIGNALAQNTPPANAQPAAASSVVPSAASPAQAAAPTAPDFTGTPASGDSSIVINGTSGQSISVYQIDGSATVPKPAPLGVCGTLLHQYKGTLLPITPSGSSTSTSNSVKLSGAPPYTINLSAPLQAGTKLCLEQTGSTGKTPLYSAGAVAVSDSNNPYPFVRTFYTAGVMIDNQNGSSGSSSGAEYLDIGMSFAHPESFLGSKPGINTSISGRFSDIPVAASSTTTSSSSNSGTLNILSSQESARVLGDVSFPFRTWRTSDGGYGFFSAPLLKAGFDTLLNPAASATTGSSGSATVSTASFAPVYWEYSSGMRMGYRQYSNDPNATPRTITQVNITIGKFSNLQSFVCKPGVISGTSTTEPTNTSCFTPQTAGATSYTLEEQSRTDLYRMEVEGFFQFPGTPFVIGVDANLPQSALAPRNLDIMNKPGGNVSIYFGVSGSLTGFFKNLKLAGSGQ